MQQIDSLTKQEVTARNMAALSTREQTDFWEKEFKPLLAKEDDLRAKLRTVSLKIQNASK